MKGDYVGACKDLIEINIFGVWLGLDSAVLIDVVAKDLAAEPNQDVNETAGWWWWWLDDMRRQAKILIQGTVESITYTPILPVPTTPTVLP